MFTGIIEELGITVRVTAGGGLLVRTAFTGVVPGESVAVNGACLTVDKTGPGTMAFELSPETLARTTLGSLKTGEPVNLERALRLCDRLGGHLVTGHVDGKGRITRWRPAGAGREVEITFPAGLKKFIVTKGSIAVEGVSLTVTAVAGARFTCALVTHTLEKCNLGTRKTGAEVNLEADIIARYLRS